MKKHSILFGAVGIGIVLFAVIMSFLNDTSRVLEDDGSVREYHWVLGCDSSDDTVTVLYGRKFAELVEEYSDGKMSIQVFSNATIGGDSDLLQYVKNQDGANFLVQTTAPEVNYMPQLAVFDLPMAHQTIDEVRTALDDETFLSMAEAIYTEAGYHLMGFSDQSFRVMSSNRSISSFDDFHGIKIRTMENANHMAFWKALGCGATPMSFSEVYTSLQNGTIDAQENPYETIVGNRLYEQQKYIVQTNHLPHILALVTGDTLYQNLNPAEREIIDRAAEEARQYSRQLADDRVQERLDIITESGTEIVEIPDTLYRQMLEASEPVYDSIREQVGDDLVNAYLGKQ